MPGERAKLPSDAKLLYHRRVEKLTHQEIADLYPPATREAVSYRLRPHEGPARNRPHGWERKIKPEHKEGWLNLAARFYNILQRRERPLNEREQAYVVDLQEQVEGLPGGWIIDYYPDSAEGLRLRQRKPGDPPDTLLAFT